MPAVTVTCETCGKPFTANSDHARFCSECLRLRRIIYLRKYREGVRKGSIYRLTAKQAAFVDPLIRSQTLTDAEIAEACAAHGIRLSKEGVTSRRRRMGVRSFRASDGGGKPPLVVVDAENAFAAIEKTRANMDVDFIPKYKNTPTNAIPGTPEKVAVLARRLVLGEPLWNDEDPCYLNPLME